MSVSSPKWRRLPGERPGQIIGAALEVFAEKGFHGAAMDEIAAAAGVSKGTIYLYFEGKEDLFLAMVRANLEEWLALLPRVAYDPELDLPSQAAALGEELFQVLTQPKYAKLIPLVLGELNHLPALKRLYQEEILPRAKPQLTAMLEQGMALGLFRPVDPVVAARSLFGMYFIMALTQEVLEAKHVTPMTPRDIAHSISTIYFRGLLNHDTRADSV